MGKFKRRDYNSFEFESYREIRTNIEHSNIGKDIKSIIVTSAKDKEGKSTVLSNLAISFANINKKVLIIDCNLKNPSIHRFFNLDNKNGLTDIIIKNKDYKDCIQKSKERNLDILTSGKISLSLPEVLSQKNIEEFINKMKANYDYIFIDASSIGSSIDAGIVSEYADGTIFVISPEKINNDELRISKQRLENLDANMIGIIFNKYNKKSIRKGHFICYPK